ncbi:protein-methionine-sulfoxide reductase heme-binding subunit MsrQ [Anaeromyxobacter oryzae]|uniref:Protein-methionine-sulfoxide reductase heme-binding subunit MsrQ n=1 Tax=Anaeromyxobacter oryzae TaxID=2918170 RepID=A0ABN6MST6_9BACT|nr:protein-methionine-sulfoxide reductase heme-binding subunit MsrQ [Anaeromyxobacter oryzae]BDG04040.1 protein-methionine-sulfoxide reductase heme-binding subunit MsrQ [Anaeromyxobacter oryzae]
MKWTPARTRALKASAFVLCLVPLAKIAFDAFTDGLGANPIEQVLNRLGFWTLTLLTLSLVPTPVKELLGVAWPVRLRRLLGLFAFAYATLHLCWYVGVDQFFDLHVLAKDVLKRKFMAVGFVAWLSLAPLAVTSTDRWVRRLGFPRWKRLHRLAYAAAVLGIVHFVWRVKADALRPYVFATILAGLLGARVAVRLARARAATAAPGLARGAGDTGAGAGGA